MPTMPYSRGSAIRNTAHVTCLDAQGQAELGVVGHGDDVGLALEAEQQSSGPTVSYLATGAASF
ncbi:hypothetical protein CIK02_13675 [Pseudomonas putida]|nr:hypothetical protein CIK02_13675 [Pseudomonas putida]